MWIWKCNAIDLTNDKEVSQIFDDSTILLDCIAESEKEAYHFCIDTCLNWCRDCGYMFESFELLAN